MARKAASHSSARSASKKTADARRKLVVFSTLAGSVTLTALLLQFLSPPPVRAQAPINLFASESTEDLARLVSQRQRDWKYIFIHHSKTIEGDAQSLAGRGDLGDHFVIGNGKLAGDGEMQIGLRWTNQLPAAAPRGVRTWDADCISICLVGDFDRHAPTAAQMRRLSELVQTLQQRHQISADHILLVQNSATPAGVGANFPLQQFRQVVLP